MTNGIEYNTLREKRIRSWKQAGFVKNVLSGENTIEDVRVPRKSHVYGFRDSVKLNNPHATKEDYDKAEIRYMVSNAENFEDMEKIRERIGELRNRGYNIVDEQVEATRKSCEISEKMYEKEQRVLEELKK